MRLAAEKTDVYLSLALKSANLSGTITRSSRLLLKCDSLDSFTNTITVTLENLGTSGYFKILCGPESRNRQFGKGIKKSYCDVIKSDYTDQDKIYSGDDFLIFNTANVMLIVDSRELEDMDFDLLRDNIAIFVDTIHAWLEHHSKLWKDRKTSENERQDITKKLQDFTRCLTRLNNNLIENQQLINEELISSLSAIFPTLGLEPDQEETILNIVESTVMKEQQVMQNQVNQNNDVTVLIHQAIDALMARTQQDKVEDILQLEAADSSNVTLF